MATKILLSADTAETDPQTGEKKPLANLFHTATGEIQGMSIEAKSQCPQRARNLVGAFENTLPEEGFQMAANAAYRAVELAKNDGCAASIQVFRHS